MATAKPKLQGYVREDLFSEFEKERHSLGLSQSQTLEKVLSERYQIKLISTEGWFNKESLQILQDTLLDLQTRVGQLEKNLHHL